jgi:OmcA/MtrC family decaheme c-type cytochrome
VTDGRCDQCHGDLTAHEERFSDVEQCPVCHQPELRQADGGGDLVWHRLMHRVHAGSELPSVSAGEPLVFTAHDGGVLDATTSTFPRTLKHCESCHDAQGGSPAWSGAPSIAACGACHDRTAFGVPAPAGFTPHSGGMATDVMCATCHGRGDVEARHAHPSFDAGVPGLEIELLGVSSTGPGQSPVIDFRITRGGAARDVIAQPLSRLRFQLVGPNTEFRGWELAPLRSAVAQGPSSGGALVAMNGAAGEFRYTFPATISLPFGATGSFTISADASLLVGSSSIIARSPMRAFAVTDPSPVPRRSIIDPTKCDACHLQLEAHGSRRGAESCVICHDSSLDDGDYLPRFENSSQVARSLDFKVMIHAIHRGAQLSAPYQLGAFPSPSTTNPAGTQRDFSTVRMPRSVGECAICHLTPVGEARPNWSLPFPSSAPVRHRSFTCGDDPEADVDLLCAAWTGTARSTPPQTAVCTSCHDQPWVIAHAEVNTTASGVEACATCHELH